MAPHPQSPKTPKPQNPVSQINFERYGKILEENIHLNLGQEFNNEYLCVVISCLLSLHFKKLTIHYERHKSSIIC